jgi:hypothetical protein
MGKRTQKLLVYLDQNFLSEMSKADVNEKVRPEFRDIYELLHRGFVDEKLVVPSSLLHDIESSLATHLKDRISTYQHYLGQARLRRPDEIRNAQVSVALDRFKRRGSEDLLNPKIAFLDDPDKRVERFDIHVDGHWERQNFRQSRHVTAKQLVRICVSDACNPKSPMNSSSLSSDKRNKTSSWRPMQSTSDRFPRRSEKSG